MSTSPLRCLLVDDRPENLVALSALLKEPGVELLEAQSGRRALELLAGHEVALAIIDVRMPDMDGFQLAEAMRGQEALRDVPIILVTAADPSASRMFRGYEAGAVDFLSKPINPVQLRSKAETFFRLARKKRALEESLRVNELLMAVLGHDLRNPLNTLVAALDVLTPEAREDQVRTLDTMRHTVGRMNEMIAQLLDFVRARQGGGIPVDPRPVDLRSVVHRVVNEHRLAHRDRQFVVDLRGEALTGLWDEHRLAQLLSNLLENSVRHGQRGAPVEVVVDGTDPRSISLAVSNAGTIDPDSRAQLFQPHFGLNRKRKDGLGLGLHIVQQIATGHGGEVVLAPSETHTTFVVKLPRQS